jgi:teichuronic acid biosynthesis glycosyltransferase TuaG
LSTQPSVTDEPGISVVIPTFQRREACEAAVRSVMGQTLAPLEVIVCDDGSSDDTQEFFEAWALTEPLLRYVRLETNTGTPGAPRNLGVSSARGEWVAFLDDDDRWLRDKLERQAAYLESRKWDVVAGNAWRSGQQLYFPDLVERLEPSRREILRTNPVIISSAVVRKRVLVDAGGFSLVRRLASIADYCLWMSLADTGARFLINPEPVVIYASEGEGRLSHPMDQLDILRQALRRAARTPNDLQLLEAATVHGWRLVKILVRVGLGKADAMGRR